MIHKKKHPDFSAQQQQQPPRTTYKCFSSNSKIDLRLKEENLRRKFLELKSTKKIIARESHLRSFIYSNNSKIQMFAYSKLHIFLYPFKIKAAFFY